MCRVCNIRFSVVYLLLCSCARVFVITACQCVRHKRKKKGKKKRLHSERSRGNFHLSDTRDIPPPWIHTYSLFVISIQIFAFRICLTFFFSPFFIDLSFQPNIMDDFYRRSGIRYSYCLSYFVYHFLCCALLCSCDISGEENGKRKRFIARIRRIAARSFDSSRLFFPII